MIAFAVILVGALASGRWLGDAGSAEPVPLHVHALGLNPADGALFIATHTGMFRLDRDAQQAERVGDRFQDTMGFTVVGPDRFLGSGHPDLRDDLPPLLGLIESRDAGENWTPVSLLGKVDFHVLRVRAERVLGYDATGGRVMTSEDRGQTWRAMRSPEPLVDVAVDPTSVDRLVAAGESGLLSSRDGGRTWKPLGRRTGLLAWPQAERLYLLDVSGGLWASADAGRSWRRRGRIGVGGAALLAVGPRVLYAATHAGAIVRSRDGGASWMVRSRP